MIFTERLEDVNSMLSLCMSLYRNIVHFTEGRGIFVDELRLCEVLSGEEISFHLTSDFFFPLCFHFSDRLF